MAQSYWNDIPSLFEEQHGNLPAVLGNVDLNRGIRAGDAINRQHLVGAKKAATTLRLLHETQIDNRITELVVDSAELRATAIEMIHASVKYTPINVVQGIQDILQQLGGITDRLDGMNVRLDGMNVRLDGMNVRLDGMSDRLDEVAAACHNNRLILRNHHTVPQHYTPLLKTNRGDGLQLANALYGHFPNLQPALVAGNPPVVGTAPPDFHTNFTTYTRVDIIGLIIFYNDDFGIVAGDTVPESISKFQLFLSQI